MGKIKYKKIIKNTCSRRSMTSLCLVSEAQLVVGVKVKHVVDLKQTCITERLNKTILETATMTLSSYERC